MNSVKKEGNDRVGKTRDLTMAAGDIKGTCCARMHAIKELSFKGMTRSYQKQKRERRGSKNTEKNFTNKVLMTQQSRTMW